MTTPNEEMLLLILENQRRIMAALAMLLSRGGAKDRKAAEDIYKGAVLTREKLAEWKRA